MDNNCVVCGMKIDKNNWDRIKRDFPDLTKQVDTHGEDSLTESQQILYHNKVHNTCYYELY